MHNKLDCVIIGAGAVGLAIARELSTRHPEFRIGILEKNAGAGLEASRFNSGVIHSGLHLNPKFLKARFAREGSVKVVEFCKTHHVSHRKCGMAVVGSIPRISELGSVPGQLLALRHLRARAREQNIGIQFLFGGEIKKYEPYLKSFFGLYVANVHIIDPVAFTSALLADAAQTGRVSLLTDHKVTGIERNAHMYRATTARAVFEAPLVVNAAGLYAHEVARAAGFEYKIFYYSGEYYKVVSEKRDHIRGTLVYPAIRPGHPGLGIHITKKFDGEVYLGPNARPCDGPILKDTLRTPPGVFADAVGPFWPEITATDLEWAYAGVRPKAVSSGEGDFVIKKETERPTFVNLIGIESPGLTASLAIAEYVADML